MPEPITFGSIVAGLMAIVAQQALKTGVSEGVKDAYAAVQRRVKNWVSAEEAMLEADPSSADRQASLAEAIDSSDAETSEEFRDLVRNLQNAVKKDPNLIGLDIGRLVAKKADLSDMSVAEGTGARIAEAQVDEFVARNLRVGDHDPN